jgi:hypothetical protein
MIELNAVGIMVPTRISGTREAFGDSTTCSMHYFFELGRHKAPGTASIAKR